MLLHQRFDFFADGGKHIAVAFQVDFIRDRAETGNDFGIVVGQGQHAICSRNHAFRATAAGNVDERLPDIEKRIAHAEQVAFLKLHNGVALGIRVGQIKAKYFCAVKLVGHRPG